MFTNSLIADDLVALEHLNHTGMFKKDLETTSNGGGKLQSTDQLSRVIKGDTRMLANSRFAQPSSGAIKIATGGVGLGGCQYY